MKKRKLELKDVLFLATVILPFLILMVIANAF